MLKAAQHRSHVLIPDRFALQDEWESLASKAVLQLKLYNGKKVEIKTIECEEIAVAMNNAAQKLATQRATDNRAKAATDPGQDSGGQTAPAEIEAEETEAAPSVD